MDAEGLGRLDEYFERIGKHLPDVRQRASFATYALGLFGDSERKSVEPIAARACPDPADCQRMHNRLLDFLGRGRWEDRPVRLEAARYVVEALSAQEKVHVWVIDDTGFLKQGKESAGVQRQYTGSAGKTANCQIGVSLSIATPRHRFQSTSSCIFRSAGQEIPRVAHRFEFRKTMSSRPRSTWR